MRQLLQEDAPGVPLPARPNILVAVGALSSSLGAVALSISSLRARPRQTHSRRIRR